MKPVLIKASKHNPYNYARLKTFTSFEKARFDAKADSQREKQPYPYFTLRRLDRIEAYALLCLAEAGFNDPKSSAIPKDVFFAFEMGYKLCERHFNWQAAILELARCYR